MSVEVMDGEKELLSCKTHWKNYALPLIGAGLFFVLFLVRVCFFGGPLILSLHKYIGGIANYTVISFVELGLFFVLAIWCFNMGMHHFFVKYTITTERLILHRGFLNTSTTELKLCYCSNLILRQNLAGKILGYGDFMLRAGGVDMFFNDVPHPNRFKSVLTRAIAETEYNARRQTSLEWLENDLGLN